MLFVYTRPKEIVHQYHHQIVSTTSSNIENHYHNADHNNFFSSQPQMNRSDWLRGAKHFPIFWHQSLNRNGKRLIGASRPKWTVLIPGGPCRGRYGSLLQILHSDRIIFLWKMDMNVNCHPRLHRRTAECLSSSQWSSSAWHRILIPASREGAGKHQWYWMLNVK